jgi:hypothetical protein
VSESEAAEAQRRPQRLRVDRSELMRDALHRHLARLASEYDAKIWEKLPLAQDEKSSADVADWGPAEDWSDGADAAG